MHTFNIDMEAFIFRPLLSTFITLTAEANVINQMTI